MPPDPLRWRDIRTTTPFRLSLVFGAIFLLGLWATLTINYLLTARELTARSDRILAVRAKTLLAEPTASLRQRIAQEIASAAPGISYYAALGRDGKPIIGNISLSTKPSVDQTIDSPAVPGKHGPLRLLAVRNPAGDTIIVGRDISQIESLRMRLLEILIASGIGGTVFVLAASVLLSMSPLRRIGELDRVSRAIAAGAFQNRMPIAGRGDELDQFAATVNRMLDEIAFVIDQVKLATDAIAHDLRTPLTRVRAALDRSRQDDSPGSTRAITVEQALIDLDNVLDRFAGLLRISEIEASGRRAAMRHLDLAPLIAELVDLYQPLANERSICLEAAIATVPPVFADRELLFEALANLVDNAIKFARSRIDVSVTADRDHVTVAIQDDGPGIPVHQRRAVLQRFHRIGGASVGDSTGLGLAVVGSILHLHGADLEFGDANPGLIAAIRLPLLPGVLSV